ncbi:M20/M25/M40 family metallo-hydrolase [Metabacillus idriensis]|uniref:M20/M25/M40 family metallo-hydrolase n=1 Tax=Metabacillus idriensis TaxID=324768 RepID=UPI003D2B8D15
MKNWNQLFISQGFMVEEKAANTFSCIKETEENMLFLLESLEKLGVIFTYEIATLEVFSPVVAESEWLDAVDFKYRGRGEGLWFRPGQEQPKIKELDTYISGVVRHLNRLGFNTMSCCDGHERRMPSVIFEEEVEMEDVVKVLVATGIKKVFTRDRKATLAISRLQLLDVALKLAAFQQSWIKEDLEFIKKQYFLLQLEECLSINGESGNEETIRQYVVDKMKPHVDFVTVDKKGNILAQKNCGTAQGPVILFNAHLDTVEEIYDGRMIEKNGAIWSSSEGILGADDRAGVTILLELIQRLDHLKFNGKVKFIFTVEEEVGLVGARKVEEFFLWDVDAAFVVDRRNKTDIITSCGGYIPFCHHSFGKFVEESAISQDLEGWKCMKGGSSDTRIWASHGIQSVNLSVGYQNEHTDAEILDTDACYNTLQLLIGIILQHRELRRVLRLIKREAMISRMVNGA